MSFELVKINDMLLFHDDIQNRYFKMNFTDPDNLKYCHKIVKNEFTCQYPSIPQCKNKSYVEVHLTDLNENGTFSKIVINCFECFPNEETQNEFKTDKNATQNF